MIRVKKIAKKEEKEEIKLIQNSPENQKALDKLRELMEYREYLRNEYQKTELAIDACLVHIQFNKLKREGSASLR